MANRYPLILDTSDGNKIKELPANDNLYLRTNSIHEVQDINALGTINAADIKIGGQRIQPKSLLDLTDTPTTFNGQENRLLKVNSSATGLDFVDIGDLGDITAGTINLTDDLIPTQTENSIIGTPSRQFQEIYVKDTYSNLRGYDGTLVFDAENNQVLYSAIVGAPDSLSEFTNDVGYITISQVADYVSNNLIITDFVGSVFGDDSTVLVDGINNKIVGPIEAPSIVSESYIEAASTVSASGFGSNIPNEFINLGVNASSVNLAAPINMLNFNITNATEISATKFNGDIIGSLKAVDESVIIDAVNKEIVATINDLKIIGETNNGNEISDTVNPVEWLKITANGYTRYIKLYA